MKLTALNREILRLISKISSYVPFKKWEIG